MRKSEVQFGKVYLYKRSGKLVKVKITGSFMNAYVGVDLSTGRNVYISSARRLRGEAEL